MATHWVFNYLSVKTIKHRLNTTFQKETLLIQIADELSKVPDALYQTFTKEQKEEFVEDVNEYLKDGDSSESLEKSIIIHPVIRKRYENKFNYFQRQRKGSTSTGDRRRRSCLCDRISS